MLVYRLCRKSEIENIINNHSFSDVGNYNEINLKYNTHCYESGKKYMHFFHDENSIFYTNTAKGNYICIYDIPIDLLNTYKGIGFYLDYFNFRNLLEVVEYAIPTEMLDYSFLDKVYEITDFYDIEDYLFGDKNQYLNKIYDRSNRNIKQLK